MDALVTFNSVRHGCHTCHKLLTGPVQAACGHRLCANCADAGCATCDQGGGSQFPDNAIAREIAGLDANCKNGSCEWRGTLGEYQVLHRDTCAHRQTVCETCGVLVAQASVHQCTCRHCRANVPPSELAAHMTACEGVLSTCPRCGETAITVGAHICSVPDGCPFAVLGCDQSHEPGQGGRRHMELLLQHVMGQGDAEEDIYTAEPAHRTLIENIVCVLNREVERTSMAIEQMCTMYRALHSRVANLEVDLQTVRREAAQSFDGTMLWSIANYAHHMQPIDSPIFHTDRYGYSMRLKLYPRGDGIGRGTHMSLFFVILRGQYDDVLPWPFAHKVTLSMLAEGGGVQCTTSFRPTTCNSFQRPTGPANVGSGSPLFCCHNRVAMTTAGTVYIKAVVELRI